ncbi:MAG TPA: hypothetical protein VL981_02655 [Candidatus Methylacidiphilales bacterium]|nr:hypothetical protein [Candidatus Methylacidiphilales bacterium]
MSDTVSPPRRPGGQMSARPLHFIWLADGSGSMRVDGKIQALNNAIREAIPHMQTVARENPHAAVLVRAMRFADRAEWLMEKPAPVSEFRWQDIEAGGVTALGEALALVGDVLESPFISDRALPPVIALVTDGLPTDDFHAGLNHLMSKPWGRQALRIVVAIGEDAASPEAQEIFRVFVANDTLRPFQANNPEALVEHIRWVSTAALKSVSAPSSQVAGASPYSIVAAGAAMTVNDADVW